MPKLIEQTDVTIEMRDLARRSPIVQPSDKRGHISLQPRSKGIHVSAVLRYCAIQAKILKPGDRLEEDLPLWMALGFAWEEFAASLYPEICWQPGEMERNGVYGTPDGISGFTPKKGDSPKLIAREVARALKGENQIAIEEFKFTRKKTRKGDEILDEWLWMQQLRSYCGFYSSTLSRLHVAYINGDYKPLEPKYMRYVILFTDAEIASTWAMIDKNKDKPGVNHE